MKIQFESVSNDGFSPYLVKKLNWVKVDLIDQKSYRRS